LITTYSLASLPSSAWCLPSLTTNTATAVRLLFHKEKKIRTMILRSMMMHWFACSFQKQALWE